MALDATGWWYPELADVDPRVRQEAISRATRAGPRWARWLPFAVFGLIGGFLSTLNRVLHWSAYNPGLPELAWDLVLAVTVGAFFGLLLAVVQRRTLRTRILQELVGRCRSCGYDLTGNASGRCPECGATVTTADGPGTP